jgi:hypothetical protein
MDKIGAETKRIAAAREYAEPGFQFTRRTIALTITFAVMILPILAGWLTPDLDIIYGYVETASGFMFFTEPTESVTWTIGNGIILGPVHWHLMYAIAGMYFGASSVK